MPHARPQLTWIAALLAPAAALARPATIASFDDDAGDATGPGSYRRPGDGDIVDGDFDLRRFVVRADGDTVIFEVTLGAPFREPAVTARGTVTQLPLWNHVYLQNIDIYIDTDPSSRAGSAECIPGRRVAFPEGRTWKAAVVLTPQPGATRDIVRDALGEVGKRVVVPSNLTTSGRTVTARVPAKALGGLPAATWTWSVHVSGARWERSFDVADRLIKGKPRANAFTMEVKPIGEAWAFGGAPAGDAHPRVVDVLLPRGVDQKAVLGSFDRQGGTWARVPFVSLDAVPVASAPPPPVAPAPAAAVVVADVDGKMVTLRGDLTGVAPLSIGRVVDASGALVGRVVVQRLLEGGALAEIVDGAERIVRGTPVSFAREPAQPLP